VEAAEGRMAHNGWNGVDGMVSNTWKPCVWCIWYHSTYLAPTITTSPSSPIKVSPSSGDTHTHTHTLFSDSCPCSRCSQCWG
jgi:hypothetical protein